METNARPKVGTAWFKPAIFMQELRMHRIDTLGYGIGMAAIFAIFIYFFDTFRESAAILDELLKNFPPEFKAAFGFSEVTLSEINGYITFLFSYVVLIGAVYGMKLGISSLSEEGRTKTSDFLLTKPIQRKAIVLSKTLAGIALLAGLNLCLYAFYTVQLTALHGDSVDQGLVALMTLSIFLVQLFFLGIGSALATLLPKVKSVMPITLGVVFFFFIIELVNQSLNDQKLTYLSPFSYFKGSQLLNDGAYRPELLALCLVVAVAGFGIALWHYIRKDVHAV